MLQDKIELEIKNALKEDIIIPEKLNECINKGLENIEELSSKRKFIFNNYNFFKFSAAIFLFAIIAVSMPLLSNTSKYIRNIFGIYNKGIDNALDFGYFENISMDYVESNGVSIKAVSMLMDDLNLDILLEYKINKEINNIESIDIKGLKIVDENNNILYNEDNRGYSTSSGMHIVESINDNIARQTIALGSNKFPNSKKIYIEFTGINIYTIFNKYTYTGKWNINIDVSPKFYERKVQKYTSEVNNYFNIETADLTSSGLNLKINFNDIFNEHDFEKIFKTFKILDESGKEIQRGPALSLSKQERVLTTTYIGITKYKPLDRIYVQFSTENDEIKVELKLNSD